ncbi:hypothetical protein ACROYT_G018235 [Oculina patagonica]
MSALDLVPRVLSISPSIHWINVKNWFICSSISSLCSVRAAQTTSAHFFVVFVKENTSLQLVFVFFLLKRRLWLRLNSDRLVNTESEQEERLAVALLDVISEEDASVEQS